MSTTTITTRAAAFFAALILGIAIMMGSANISQAQTPVNDTQTYTETGWHGGGHGGGGHWGGGRGGHR